MEAVTTIRKMMSDKAILVPVYQRAYSWDNAQTTVFLSDLEKHQNSGTSASYYFGHFLFEDGSQNNSFFVIDGQQRLTTMVIFLAALFSRLKQIRTLTQEEEEFFADSIKKNAIIRFSTVGYDQQFFVDYVIEQKTAESYKLETQSSRRIKSTFDKWQEYLSEKEEDYLCAMLKIIDKIECTTHFVKDESTATQLFIFQNDRGKEPSNLEIVKAQFIHTAYLYGGDSTKDIVEQIKKQFEGIYRAIFSLESYVTENQILLYSSNIYFRILSQHNVREKIDRRLAEPAPINFIQEFMQCLSRNCKNLSKFFKHDEKEHFEIHSFVAFSDFAIGLPFILKAYEFGFEIEDIKRICHALESIVVRHHFIATQASLVKRLNDLFVKFSNELVDFSDKLEKNKILVGEIIGRVNWMKETTDWWWHYWNNTGLERKVNEAPYGKSVKHILWRYRAYLETQKGYKPSRFENVSGFEIEHIAPEKEPSEKDHGYTDVYKDDQAWRSLWCLGNYTLLPSSLNHSLGNASFSKKLARYGESGTSLEIHDINPSEQEWSRKLIQEREKRILNFILETF